MTAQVTVERQGDRARVSVTGELDLEIRDRFLDQICALVRSGARIVLDLRRLSSIDSTGLSSVIQADRLSREAGEAGVKVLIADSGPVRRMFELTLLHLSLDVTTG